MKTEILNKRDSILAGNRKIRSAHNGDVIYLINKEIEQCKYIAMNPIEVQI